MDYSEVFVSPSLPCSRSTSLWVSFYQRRQTLTVQKLREGRQCHRKLYVTFAGETLSHAQALTEAPVLDQTGFGSTGLRLAERELRYRSRTV